MASEDQVVRRLRALIFVIFGLGLVAAVLGTNDHRFFIVWFLVPGASAYLRPRWPQIVIWIMWSWTIGMLGFLLTLEGMPELMAPPTYWLMAIAMALLYIAVPLVRRMHQAPPLIRGRSRIPEARVYLRS